MTTAATLLGALRRPRLLVQAARAGVSAYVRDVHLAPLAPTADPQRDPAGVIARLRTLEEEWEAARRARATQYSPGRHVAVLVALLAEARLCAARPA